MKIITPTLKFWIWRNYKKSLFQSYKAVLATQNHAKRNFFGEKSYAQICALKIGVDYAKKCCNYSKMCFKGLAPKQLNSIYIKGKHCKIQHD
jgi:hypothetical protein